jgi:hypothetical protein
MTAPDQILAKRGMLPAALAEFAAELRRNKRALTGIIAILALLAGYGVLLLDDGVVASRAAYLESGRRLDRLAAIGHETDWPARAAASQALRRTLEQRLWPADSDGVARADLQDWVTNTAHAVGLERLQVAIELSHPKELPDDLRKVSAKLTAVQSEPALQGFLERVARDPHRIVVERLHAQQHPMPLLEMTLTTWARIARPKPGATQR